MSKAIVIGLGETGIPLYEILKEAYFLTEKFDLNESLPKGEFEIMNICIPYSDTFVESVKKYQQIFKAGLTIIHSTVPIGTTGKINDAVHSPILGDHKTMKESIKNFIKWIGGAKAQKAREFFIKAGIKCHCVSTSEETETLKLFCLAKYGMSIAFAKYEKSIADLYGFDYHDIMLWDTHYNEGLSLTNRNGLKRPIIYNDNGSIKGHCIIPNVKLLNEKYPNQILREILLHE